MLTENKKTIKNAYERMEKPFSNNRKKPDNG